MELFKTCNKAKDSINDETIRNYEQSITPDLESFKVLVAKCDKKKMILKALRRNLFLIW